MTQETPPLLSVVVPCFNEEEVIAEAHRCLMETLAGRDDIRLELIYVDDGSRDRTLELLEGIQAAETCVKVVSLSRNFGHQIAVTAGLDYCTGDVMVIIDADLQDPPEVILGMLDRWREGVDVVYGVREHREGETRFKLFTAALFYRLINGISDIPIPLDTGDFRLMDRRAVDALMSMPERDRFVRGMVAWVGFRQEPIRYHRNPRFAGVTKYPLKKMIRFAADGIISFSSVPLKIASWVGLFAFAVSMLGIVYATVMRLATDNWVPGWSLLFIAMMFLGGLQLLFLGIIGEYLGRVYGEVKRRPLYLVKLELGVNPEGATTRRTGSDHA